MVTPCADLVRSLNPKVTHKLNIKDLFDQTPHPIEVSDYFHTYNLSNILNVAYWNYFLDITRCVPGAIVECGVGRGRSLLTILALNMMYEKKKVFALDSFKGFPEPTELDMSSRNPKKCEWSESPNKQFKYSIENLIKLIANADLNYYLEGGELEDRLEIVEGFFEQTTQSLKVSEISILHLDGDLYKSVKDPLLNLWSRVSVGGLIVIDDFQLHAEEGVDEPWPGARAAVREFLKINRCFAVRESMRGTPFLQRLV